MASTWLIRAGDSLFMAEGSARMVLAPRSLLPEAQLGPERGVLEVIQAICTD
eukprot:CAMPEP_0179415474 /NCGR_PEP_ID=MMETSP0799-20121207/6251_1 /TAXON_ID=46947 /ORGANISM="Geminigera cryophila, Strain CCMP2564" /LENGTH=51 /DNA_ID=CAMNT_0021188215 /DNA_START=496 /DNA_END=648 /DNA_ORIENTATION=-